MKKLNLGISAMLMTAVLAGAAGGAVALSAAVGDPAPSQPPVTLHQVADEATVAAPVDAEPNTTPSADPAGTETPEAPVSEPAPIVEPVAKSATTTSTTETASQAADRAKAEADRAKAEADRAQQAAEAGAADTSTAVPTQPTSVTTPAPAAAADCPGGKPGDVRESVTERGTYTKECRDGEWVVIKFTPKPTPSPEPDTTVAEEEVSAGNPGQD